MSNVDVIRAWKDEEYRLSLSETQLAMLPDNPAGLVELSNPFAGDLGGVLFTEQVVTQCLTCVTLCVPTFVASCTTFCPINDIGLNSAVEA